MTGGVAEFWRDRLKFNEFREYHVHLYGAAWPPGRQRAAVVTVYTKGADSAA
jgi:hypothetical protein